MVKREETQGDLPWMLTDLEKWSLWAWVSLWKEAEGGGGGSSLTKGRYRNNISYVTSVTLATLLGLWDEAG